MAKLYSKKELVELVLKLADVVPKMTDTSKYCLSCEMHENGSHVYHCWCDYDSPAYVDDGDH